VLYPTSSGLLDAGLSPRTVEYIHTTLHKALKNAIADGPVPRNVTDAVKAPRAKGKEINALAPDQTGAFLEAAGEAGDRFEALYLLAITAGRLKWEDLDLDAGTLSVRRTLSEARSGRFFEAPRSVREHGGQDVGQHGRERGRPRNDQRPVNRASQYGASEGTICQGSPSCQIITRPAIVSSSTNITTASAISAG
jgi:integrase